jgi:transcriptional regulator GlxA family with amidase domain
MRGFVAALLFVSLAAAAPGLVASGMDAAVPGPGRSGEVEILVLVCAPAGINYNLIRDAMELQGWNVTVGGLTPTVNQCAYGGPIETDMLISKITDLSPYDCLLISTSRAWSGSSHQEFLDSPEVLSLVSQAVSEGLLVGALCGGTRVLAAAGVINGVTVTGHPLYSQEYVDAGANYIEGPVPPVVDGNILTSRRNQTYSHRLCEVIRATLDGMKTGTGTR